VEKKPGFEVFFVIRITFYIENFLCLKKGHFSLFLVKSLIYRNICLLNTLNKNFFAFLQHSSAVQL